MKKYIALLLLLAFQARSIAQQTTPGSNKTREELLKKSNNQKTAGYLMLIGGAVAIAGGTALFAENFDLFSSEANSGEAGGAILVAAGAASMIGSIFVFSASARNKREANSMAVGFKMEKGMPFVLKDKKPAYFPAITFRLTLQ